MEMRVAGGSLLSGWVKLVKRYLQLQRRMGRRHLARCRVSQFHSAHVAGATSIAANTWLTAMQIDRQPRLNKHLMAAPQAAFTAAPAKYLEQKAWGQRLNWFCSHSWQCVSAQPRCLRMAGQGETG